uniref:Protein MIX23 n=1 Tax=Meloidogyne incognita TaxID=6306 RepID=A0A914N8R5_MELIC
MPVTKGVGAGSSTSEYICRDLGEFKKLIDRLRSEEDRIIFKLNCELPTRSFSRQLDKRKICENVHKQLLETRKRREDLLQRCINENRETLLRYRNDNKQEEDGAKTVTSKEEMSAYANLRLLREEASVEEIVRVQADKALTDRCRKELLLP